MLDYLVGLIPGLNLSVCYLELMYHPLLPKSWFQPSGDELAEFLVLLIILNLVCCEF